LVVIISNTSACDSEGDSVARGVQVDVGLGVLVIVVVGVSVRVIVGVSVKVDVGEGEVIVAVTVASGSSIVETTFPVDVR
jgi:hypothetical protein